MRLLDLQRKALGVPLRVIGSTSYTDPEPLTDVAKGADEAFVQSGTVLVAATDARPRSALIAGALVTVSVSIVNEGDVAASRVRIDLPLPAATAFRPGTLIIDGKAADDAIANDLFGNGTELTNIEPGARRNLSVKLVVEAGNNDIHLSPHLSAKSAAILGLRAIRLTRKGPLTRSESLERPFYESSADEHAIEPLLPPRSEPKISVLQPREDPTAIEVVSASHAVAPAAIQLSAPTVTSPTRTARKPSIKLSAKTPLETVVNAVLPKAKAVSKRRRGSNVEPDAQLPQTPRAAQSTTTSASDAATRPRIEVVRSVDEPISFAGQGGPILAVAIDRKRLATLSGLFRGPSLGMISHYLVLNALTVRDSLPGDGTDDAIATFVASQQLLLSRALIAIRLGKSPSPDSVGAALPAFPPALKTHAERRTIEPPRAGEAMLFRAFEPNEIQFVVRLLSNHKAYPFMRAAQLFVGLCANDAIVADEGNRHRVGVALTAYAALATAEISRIFLRAKLSGTPALFKETELAFDDAARSVLEALARTIS